MSRKFSLGYLVDQARKRSDMEHQDLVSKEEWYSYASEVYAELFEKVVLGEPQRKRVEVTIPTDGSDTYDLPENFLTALGVDFIPTSGIRRKLYRLQVQERNRFEAVRGSSEARAFEFINDQIKLHPAPPAGQEYVLVYVPHATRLESQGPGFEIDVVAPSGEKFMIWGMAALALAKEESFDHATYAQQQADRAQAAIEEWASEQLISEANRRVVNSSELDYDDDPAFYYRGGY